jgi:prepilin-type N-terminal cleavage/methylation domain-containing protein
MNRTTRDRKRNAGFTLIESMISIVILTILMVGVFSLVNKSQTHYRVETRKVDFTQQQREFIDQFTRDLHQAGFPTANSVGNNPAVLVAKPLTTLTATDLIMQGDVDGTGVLRTVEYVYNPVTAPNCSCLQRIIDGIASTAVENVAPPNPQEFFTGYDISGNPTIVLANVRSIRVTLTVQGGVDANNTPIQTTMTGMARLPNND